MPSPRAFLDARERILPHVRETRVVRLRALGSPVPAHPEVTDAPVSDPALRHDLVLKLESEQVSGAFKVRGALNRILALPADVRARGVVTASGGNHGLAVAYAARVTGVPATVYLPGRTPESKALRIERWGATALRAGDVWDDAHAVALAHAEQGGLTYVHPFADPDVVAGQGTIALELLEQAPETDLVVVAIGGGGLAAGVSAAIRALRPGVRVIGVEPVGAPTLTESLRAGRVVELDAIRTAATTLAPRRSDAYVLGIIKEAIESVVLVTDDEMRDAARFLLRELGIGAELSGAAALAAFLSGKIDLRDAKHPAAIVCGAGDGALG